MAECSPAEAWAVLSADPASALIDVRTRPEWSFVGIPDLSGTPSRLVLAEWRRFPDMSVSANFAAELDAELEGMANARLYFICRSGARSLEAAAAMTASLVENGRYRECINVAGGFEGDLDADRHRGSLNGWKASGLPWRQS